MSEQDIDYQFYPTQNFALSLQTDSALHDQLEEDNARDWQPSISLQYHFDEANNVYEENQEPDFIYNSEPVDLAFHLDATAPEESQTFQYSSSAEDGFGQSCSNIPLIGEDNQTYYEVITKAHCIDCDKLVDIKKDTHNESNCCLKKKFGCSTCGQRFNSPHNLAVHEIVDHLRLEKFVAGQDCRFCDGPNKKKKSFQRFHSYIAHIKTHIRSDVFLCTYCNEEFNFPELFQRHKRLHHATKRERERRGFSNEVGFCPKCNKLLEMEKVDSHRLVHSLHTKIDRKRTAKVKEESETELKKKKLAYTCTECSKSFRRPAELKRHKAVHEKIACWSCSICEKKFAHKSGLLSHRKKVHSDSATTKAHVCKICDQTFTKPFNLERHVKRIHPLESNRVLFDCASCPCQFSNQASLRRHAAKAHGTKSSTSLSCDMCSLVFSKKSALIRHKSVHVVNEEDKPFKCNRCSRRFKLRSSLKLHLDLHARKDIDDPVLTDPKCTICLRHFSSEANLRKHMLVHESSYECRDCGLHFATIHKLDRHRCTRVPSDADVISVMDLSGNNAVAKRTTNSVNLKKPYECKQCSASFYSFKAHKEHKAWHQGLKPHICWTCYKSFRTIELLRSHREIHTRIPIDCEFCPMVLSGRVHYGNHIRICHRNHQQHQIESSTSFPEPDRALTNYSALSYPVSEFTGRELAEGLFINRAQSVDPSHHAASYNLNIDVPLPEPIDDAPGEVIEETTNDRATRCPVCYHLYDSIAQLTTHLHNTATESQHSATVINCPLCQCNLHGSAEAAEHLRDSHPYVRSPIDEIPPVTFSSFLPELKPSINQVVDRRTDVKKYACTQCRFSFTRRSDLERHIRTHTGERPFKCDVCDKSFTVKSTLKVHKKVHEKVAPQEQCAICKENFFTKNALTLHLRIHSGEKPLQCHFCEETFRTSSLRQSHEASCHEQSKRPRKNFVASTNKTPQILPRAPTAELIVIPPTRPTKSDNIVIAAPVPEEDDSKPNLYPVKSYPVNVVKKSLVETMAQFSKVGSAPLQATKESAFEPTPHDLLDQFEEPNFTIFITAKRLSETEYLVKFSREPQAIRVGIDTTASILLSNLVDLADQNYSMRIELMDNQQLNIQPKSTLQALQGFQEPIVFHAHPYNQFDDCCVALLPPKPVDFCRRCDVCEIDLPTQTISDHHFASEDHEVAHTARTVDPLAAMEQPQQVNPTLPFANPRVDMTAYTCKLCGREFLDLDPLVAHIKREHEREHPHTFGASRLAVRTAPPLEGGRYDSSR